jgi:glycosyltransferase involved in cell wall biosynthesis
MSLASVSIVTITQYSRFHCLQNLYNLIRLQDYTNIREWIIVEGSKNIEDANINKININELKKELQTEGKNSFDIIYIEYSGPTHLSDLRNLGNEKCSSDIIVCMDDDDYYPCKKVSSIVKSFHTIHSIGNIDYKISGCSPMYMYDYDFKKLYKFKKIHNNHSTNNCMAYKREYLQNHKYQSGLDMAEESSFTNGFTEPMIQMNPLDCIVVSSHGENTFNKKQIIDKFNDKFENSYLYEVKDIFVTDLIPVDIFEKMKLLFEK